MLTITYEQEDGFENGVTSLCLEKIINEKDQRWTNIIKEFSSVLPMMGYPISTMSLAKLEDFLDEL